MRKIVLGLGMSLDGYIARPDGSVDFLFMPKDYSMARLYRYTVSNGNGKDRGLASTFDGISSPLSSIRQPPAGMVLFG